MATEIIKQFNGGMGEDPRNQNFAYAEYIKHFDIYSNPHRITPHRIGVKMDAAGGGLSDLNVVRQFFFSSIGKLIGLGVDEATETYPTILSKADVTNDTDWTKYGSAGSTYALRNYNCFFEYKDYAYGFNTNGMFRFGTLSSSLTIAESWQALANSDAAQGIIHSQDDIAYIPYADASGNWNIATWDNSTFTAIALALPTNIKVVRIVEYGGLLAIICAPKVFGETESRLLLWDRDSSLVDLDANYNLGGVEAVTAGNVDGRLVIVSLDTQQRASAVKMIFHTYSGGLPNVERTVDLTSSVTSIKGGQTVGGKFYFGVEDTSSGTGKYAGVWCFGRESVSDPFAISIDRDVSVSGSTSARLYAFLMYKDLCIASMSVLTPVVTTLSISGSGFGTATYNSQIITEEDSTTDKVLRGISTGTVYLPSAGTIVAKYRKDEETAYTQIFTDSTDNLIKREATKVEGTGNLPGFNEIQFQLISTGGAEFTHLKAKYNVLPESYA